MPLYELKSPIPVSAQDLYDWHMRPGALERLTPPWSSIQIQSGSGSISEGSHREMIVPVGPFHMKWVAIHHSIISGRQFCDELAAGPFSRWIHYHRFIPDENNSILEDEIDYRLPYSFLGSLFAGATVRKELRRLFPWRHRRTRNDLERHAEFSDRPRMRIALSGASGLIGKHLTAFLETGGHVVYPLVRNKSDSGPKAIYWNPRRGEMDSNALNNFDAVINLAGVGIADKRWSSSRKKEILESRVNGTRLLAETISKLKNPPKVFISASASGYYGDGGSDTLTEDSVRGEGFLSDVVSAWEDAALPAREAGIRTVQPRMGVVLTTRGGMLARLLPIFRFGAGGKVGNGEQYLSWISMDDLLGAYNCFLFDSSFSGPVNTSSPHPVTNRTFCRTLASILHRPAMISVPSAAIKLVYGQMGRQMLLDGQKMVPKCLIQGSFRFLHPTLETAFSDELGRNL